MPETVDAVAAYLAEAKRAAATGPVADARPLVAALEAACDLIAAWDHMDRKLAAEAAALDIAGEHPILAEVNKARAAVYAVCAGKLEMAIGAALPGGVGGDDAAASTVPRPPTSPPPHTVVVTPSQVAAAQLLTEHGGCGEHGPAVEKIAGARDTAATQEG